MAFYFHGNPYNFFCKKHYCICCNNKLTIKKKTIIVNSKSEEIKKYEDLFTDADGAKTVKFFKKDIKITHHIFYCEKCRNETENLTQLSYEKYLSKRNKVITKLKKNNVDFQESWISFKNEKLDRLPNDIFSKYFIETNKKYECFSFVNREKYEQALVLKINKSNLKRLLR